MSTKKQSLQKFTEFEEIKTTEQFADLKKNDAEKFEELTNWLIAKVNEENKKDTPVQGEFDRYYNLLEKAILLRNFGTDEVNKRAVAMFKRDRWYVNEAKIKHCIHKELANNCYLPNNTTLAELTGLSRVTIDKHLKAYGLNTFKREELDKYDLLNSMAINKLYQIGMHQENIKALTAFISLTNQSGRTVNNNFVQINNTKIDNVIIENLPTDVRLQIEALILESTQPKFINVDAG